LTNLHGFMGSTKLSASVGKWLRGHWKPLLAHSLILSGFLFYCVFLSSPLFDRFEAIDGEARSQDVSLPTESGSMTYCIDVLLVDTHIAEIRGWAFIDGQSSENSQTSVVLKSDQRCYVFDAMTLLRMDVSAAYSSLNLNLDWSGLVCNVPMRRVKNGEYLLGIYVKNGDVEAFRCTDRVLVKSESAVQWNILEQ